jgi:serine/threonine-protein kinase
MERELGRGATGVVYEALHLDLGRKVALKVLHHECGGGETRGRFMAEARAVAKVHHAGLVGLYELGFTSEGRPYYAMELVQGETLDRRLARDGRLAWRDAVSLVIKACRAVEAAHEAGLIHRDIKPGNLMLTETGDLKLLDFGIVKAESELEVARECEGTEMILMGTPEYMAPEQAEGAADARSDVYGLAAVLYELTTGVLPHHASSAAAMIELKRSAPLAPASAAAPGTGIPRALDRALSRALSASPAARFDTVEDLRHALEVLVDDRARARARRRRVGMVLVSGVTLFALLVIGERIAEHASSRMSRAYQMGRALVEQALALGVEPKASVARARAAASPGEPHPASVPTFAEDTEALAAVAEHAQPDAAGDASATAEDDEVDARETLLISTGKTLKRVQRTMAEESGTVYFLEKQQLP